MTQLKGTSQVLHKNRIQVMDKSPKEKQTGDQNKRKAEAFLFYGSRKGIFCSGIIHGSGLI